MSELDSIIFPGDVAACRFVNADAKEWIVPVRNMRTGLELYQPSGVKGIALKRVLPFVHRVSAARRVAGIERQRVKLLPELMALAERAFGEKDLEFAIFGGTPSVHCKVTVQFFKGKRILGYAKITSSEDVAELFSHEQRVFDRLAAVGVDDVPRCLHCGRLSDGRAVFIQSTVKTLDSKIYHRWLPIHENFLRNLHELTAVEVAFEDSDIAASLRQLREILPQIPANYREVIQPVLAAEYESRIGSRGVFSAFHADFTPWNMLVEGGRLFVFDWEYARFAYPPGLDRYHFFIQQAIHVTRMPANEVYSRLCNYSWFDRGEMRLYILDIISRFVGREPGSFPASLEPSMRVWCELLKK